MRMRPITHQNLGIIIAYLLPGFVTLGSLSLHSTTVRSWLGATGADAPTVGGFLYVTVASLAIGLFLNSLRGLILEPLLHRTGVTKKSWDYSKHQAQITAVEFVLAYQYRYYQFTGNMLFAGVIAYAALELASPAWAPWIFAPFFLCSIVLFLSARRILGTYYQRLDDILGVLPGTPAADSTSLLQEVQQHQVVDRNWSLGYDHERGPTSPKSSGDLTPLGSS